MLEIESAREDVQKAQDGYNLLQGQTVSQNATLQSEQETLQKERESTLAKRLATISNIAGPFSAPSGVNFSASISSLTSGSHTYKITATDRAGNQSTTDGSFTIDDSSNAAISAVFAKQNQSASLGSAKLDWTYDLGGLLDNDQ